MEEAEDTREPVVVLLSGGLDSATVAAELVAAGCAVHALTVDYGQRNRIEIQAACGLARHLGVTEHLVLRLDLRPIGGSALTSALPVPKAERPEDPVVADVPLTYVPARNALFLSLALGLAEVRGARRIGIGVNEVDYSGYPDCRPVFLEAFERMANLATREGLTGRGFVIYAPLQGLGKADILARARAFDVPVERTVSCYDPAPDGSPCGLCDSCRLRAQAERELAARAPSP